MRCQPHAIAAQIAAWETPWIDMSRVADRGRGLVGYVGVELGELQSRVWIHGPVVDDPDWDGVADALMARLESDVPQLKTQGAEIAADVANRRVAEFAERHGFVAGPVHHLLSVTAAEIEELPRPAVGAISSEHEPALAALHDQLFPGTYYSGRQLLEQAARGDALVLGVIGEEGLIGYAAGRIDEAGDGYLDFVGVAVDERRRGVGETLVVAMSHALAAERPILATRLTVSSENVAALALYDRLGFVRQSSSTGYRRRRNPHATRLEPR